MDFADFDLRSASEAGRWLHLEHGGKRLYAQPDGSVGTSETDKPCRIHLRGLMARGVHDTIRRIQTMEQVMKARLARASDRDIEAIIERHEAAAQTALRDLIVAAVGDWENIIIGGKAAELTPENLMRVCGPDTAFFGQVYQALLEARDFLTPAARG